MQLQGNEDKGEQRTGIPGEDAVVQYVVQKL